MNQVMNRSNFVKTLSRILNIHFHPSYFFKNSVNQLTGTYRILNTSRQGISRRRLPYPFTTCQQRKASIAASSCMELTDQTTDVREGITTKNPPKITLALKCTSQ